MVTGYTFDDHLSLALHRSAAWMLIGEPSQVGNAQATL